MGTYLKEFAPPIKGQGIRKISLLIEPSLRAKSVYFEIYNNQDRWFAYWNFETPISIIRQVAIDNNLILTFQESLKNEEFLKKIHQQCEVFDCELNDEDVLIVQQLLSTELPEIDRKPFGLDGHSYTVRIADLDKEYHCWCVIPKEWSCLKPLVDMLVEKSGLSDNYQVYGMA